MVRSQVELELTKDPKDRNLKSILSSAEKAKILFSKIGYKEGEERSQHYINQLSKTLNGELDTNFKKFVKFKTFKKNIVDSAKTENALLVKDMLNNEDIRLFVEVINEEDDAKDKYRRITSINFSRSNSRARSGSQKILSLSNSNSKMSLSISNLKLGSKKIKLKNVHKSGNSKFIHESPFKLLPYKLGTPQAKNRLLRKFVSVLK